jgi:hypothetical protein
MVEHNQGGQTQKSSATAARPDHRAVGVTRTKRIANLLQHRGIPASKIAPGKHGPIFLFFGVILPLVAMVFELTTHFCAQHFFDPFPSPSHVILFLLIPLSSFMAWLSGRKDMSPHYGFMALISGMAMGIGCLYALMFLPLTPHSAMYTLLFGFGLLGFAPLLSIPCSWLSGKTVCRLASGKKTFFDPHQVEHIGHLIVLCLVVAVELPSTMTRMNLSLAAAPPTEKQGIQWLRHYGSEEVMLRACYERSGRATDILGSLYESGHPLSIENARSIFYKVTGKPFNSVPIPSSARATIQHAGLVDDPDGLNAGVQDEFDLDADIAGENVSGVARGLSVSDATVIGSVNADAAVADLDWSITLSNVSKFDREARAKILLPPGGVVTKATVTVNGVERDATILVRSVARAIYKQAVVERKDPLLVSTCGLDQILIQCFPVQPESTMKVRLKIAAPLILNEDKKSAALVLPAFEERNFQFEVPDNVSINSNNSIKVPVSKVSMADLGEQHQAVFALEPTQLARFAGVVNFARDPKCLVAVTNNTIANDGSKVARWATSPTYKMPEKLVVLIDGSASMQHYVQDMAAGLKNIPSAVKTQIVVVGDETTYLGGQDNANTPEFARQLSFLQMYRPVGGHADDQRLIDSLTVAPAVLWIHGAQPVSSVDKKLLKNLLQRPSASPRLFDLQVAAGPNELLNDMDPIANVVRVPRTGNIATDLSRLFQSWQPTSSKSDQFEEWHGAPLTAGGKPTAEGVAVPAAGANFTDSVPAVPAAGVKLLNNVPAVAQLYGYQKLLESYRSADQGPALLLAEKYHLVSPVSSAVVTDLVPSNHPAPAKAALKPASPSSLGVIDQLTTGAFNKVTAQLNNLSSAASVDEKEMRTAARWDFAREKEKGQVFLSTQTHPTAEPVLESAGKSVSSHTSSSEMLEQKKVGQSAGGGAKDQFESAHENKSSYSAKQLDSPSVNDQREDEAVLAVPAAQAPSLQGATNGTIGPQGQEGGWLPVDGAPASSSASTSSAAPAPPPALPGFIGAPVDPRYGQSNEQAQSQPAPFDFDLSRLSQFSVQPQQQERVYYARALGSPAPMSMWFEGIRDGLAIFFLVFMSMFAVFKLLKAMSQPKSHK